MGTLAIHLTRSIDGDYTETGSAVPFSTELQYRLVLYNAPEGPVCVCVCMCVRGAGEISEIGWLEPRASEMDGSCSTVKKKERERAREAHEYISCCTLGPGTKAVSFSRRAEYRSFLGRYYWAVERRP